MKEESNGCRNQRGISNERGTGKIRKGRHKRCEKW